MGGLFRIVNIIAMLLAGRQLAWTSVADPDAAAPSTNTDGQALQNSPTVMVRMKCSGSDTADPVLYLYFSDDEDASGWVRWGALDTGVNQFVDRVNVAGASRIDVRAENESTTGAASMAIGIAEQEG